MNRLIRFHFITAITLGINEVVLTVLLIHTDLPYFNLGRYKRYYEIEYQPMNNDLRKYLKEYFDPHNSKLYQYLGRDFQWE